MHLISAPFGPGHHLRLAKGANPLSNPAVTETAVAGRGSENRQKTASVLVRLTAVEYRRLTLEAEREGTSRAELLRRRAAMPADDIDTAKAAPGLGETDRILLANATRSMGHLAGLMKLAVLKTGPFGRPSRLQSILDAHHDELQAMQRQIRHLLER